eukprot:TRINITY_DN22560_c0_g1_i1.p1 TRINITY_DN22560_c0_g1~~TRINITY_DN22560_c0_g1_i1.p1  ORF type:complete len:243 (-),score=29.19 TRINITY_DN22560_c0_g1_i1:279-1007(-)
MVQWSEVLSQVDSNATPHLKQLDDKQLKKLRPRCQALFQALVGVAISTNADIMHSWRRKMKKVMKKYPPELCRGRSDKYTAYTEMRAKFDSGDKEDAPANGHSAPSDGQYTSVKRQKTCHPESVERSSSGSTAAAVVPTPSVADLLESRDLYRTFASARDWDQFHTPRNLLLAMTGEVGELAQEIGKLAADDKLTEAPESLCDEIADCWSYLVRFCDKSGVGVETLVGETNAAVETSGAASN